MTNSGGLVRLVSQTLFWFALINTRLEKIKGTTFPFWILMDMPKEIMLRCFPLQVAENKDLTRVSVNSPQMVATQARVNKTCFLPQRMSCPGLTSNPGSCQEGTLTGHFVQYKLLALERICDFQFMYIMWFLVVYLTYFMKPVKETTFSSKIHKAFFANIRNDCVFSVIKNKQHSYAIRVWALSSWFPFHLQITGKRNLYKFHRNRKRVSNMQV